MTAWQRRFFRMQARDIVLFQFVIEGHEGIAAATTVDENTAVVRLSIPAGLEDYVGGVLTALRQEMGLHFREEPGWKGMHSKKSCDETGPA